jgi:hypothetical protein
MAAMQHPTLRIQCEIGECVSAAAFSRMYLRTPQNQPPCTPLHEHFSGYFMVFIIFFIAFSRLSEHCRRKLLRMSGIA